MKPDDRVRDYRIRSAVAADAAAIAHQRVAMLYDMGMLEEREPDSLMAASRDYFDRALPSGEYRGWIVERDGVAVAGGGLLLRPLLPGPHHPRGGSEAYILNVYTEPAHRRRGLARQLTEHILEWCRAHGVARAALHASMDGRPLYEQLGFAATNEMRLDLTR